MNSSKSKWAKYDGKIKEIILAEENRSLGYTELARKVLGDSPQYGDVDILRTYIRRNFGHLRKIGSSISPMKILVFDVETAPLMSYVWGLWNQNVNPVNGMLDSEYFLLTWVAKWLFEDDVIKAKLTPKEALEQDDTRIVKEMWNLFEQADVVIAHNGKNFDIKMLNARFAKHGLNPPMPYQVIDTLKHSRKSFKLPSHKLDYLGEYFGIGRKVETGGFMLWKKCLQGDKEALEQMETYNIQDVLLLEELYLKMRSWIKPHPNVGLFIADEVSSCPTCGSGDLHWKGSYKTSSSSYDSFRCNDCGSTGRSRTSNKIKNSKLTLSISK